MCSDSSKYCLIKYAIIAAIGLIVLLLPALLLYFLGYVPRDEFNQNSLETQCNVTGYTIGEDTCSYSCNCYSICTGTTDSRHCSTHCQTCYYTCYDGYINVLYNDTTDTVYNSIILIYNDYRSEGKVVEKLTKKYPINHNIDCFYDQYNPFEVKVKLYNTDVFLAFFGIFLILFFAYGFGWIIYKLYDHYNPTWFACCSQKRKEQNTTPLPELFYS